VTKPAAVLVDMDGTLIDSEPTWFQAVVDLLAAWGFELGPEHYEHVLGKPMLDSTTYLMELCGGPRSREEFEDGVELAMIERLRTGVPLLPGAKRLLRELDSLGVPVALVSASSRRIIEASMPWIGAEHFRFTVSGDDVERGKPHPDPYLRAAQLLGVDPLHCVVVEDSPTGVGAGHAAGCQVVAVPHAVPIEGRERVTVVDSLERVSHAFLGTLFL
jgi:HAD superfamily hydrolase (TIGR01509 family)